MGVGLVKILDILQQKYHYETCSFVICNIIILAYMHMLMKRIEENW